VFLTALKSTIPPLSLLRSRTTQAAPPTAPILPPLTEQIARFLNKRLLPDNNAGPEIIPNLRACVSTSPGALGRLPVEILMRIEEIVHYSTTFTRADVVVTVDMTACKNPRGQREPDIRFVREDSTGSRRNGKDPMRPEVGPVQGGTLAMHVSSDVLSQVRDPEQHLSDIETKRNLSTQARALQAIPLPSKEHVKSLTQIHSQPTRPPSTTSVSDTTADITSPPPAVSHPSPCLAVTHAVETPSNHLSQPEAPSQVSAPRTLRPPLPNRPM
jgi:hypothetical protein